MPFTKPGVSAPYDQTASTELLPSEQLGGGGADSVRGYDPRAVNGSEGALASFELRSPTLHPLQAIAPDAAPAIDDGGQLLAFYDYGYVGYKHAQQALARHAELQGVGVACATALAAISAPASIMAGSSRNCPAQNPSGTSQPSPSRSATDGGVTQAGRPQRNPYPPVLTFIPTGAPKLFVSH